MRRRKILKPITKTIKSSVILSFAAKLLLYGFLRLLFMTYRLRVTVDKSLAHPMTTQPGVFYFWHQQIIAGMLFFFKTRSTGYCVVSPSRDGKFVGYITRKLGFTVLYGSAHKGTVTLLRSALKVLQTDQRLCIVGDGSRGPAFKLQQGISYLAQKSQVPLVYVECRSQWHYTFKKSWDQFQIPLPFSKIFVRVHKPSVVPSTLPPEVE